MRMHKIIINIYFRENQCDFFEKGKDAMKRRKWERWIADVCVMVLLGSFFVPVAVGKAGAETDSLEEILAGLETSPAKIYADYLTGMDRVVADAEGRLLYDAMLAEPESYFLCMTLDEELGLSADVAIWYSYLMEGGLSDIVERINVGSYEAAVLLDILASNASAFTPLETNNNIELIQKLGEDYAVLQDFNTLTDIESVDVPAELGLTELEFIPDEAWDVVDITAENLLEGIENLAKLYEIYAQRESMITMLTEMRQNCMDDAHMQAGIDIVLGSLQEESVWDGAVVWKNIQLDKAGADAIEYLVIFGADKIPILGLALKIREVMPVVINEAIFDFNEFNGQMRMVEVTERYARALIVTAKTLNAQYLANPTEENARKCVEAFEMVYRLALYDKDLFETFAQALLRSGALNALVKDAFETKYSGILENLEDMREYIEESHARVERIVDAYTDFQVEKGTAPTPAPVTLPSVEWEWVLEPFMEADDIQPVDSVYNLVETGMNAEVGNYVQEEMALWVDGKVGLIDYQGNILIEPQYEKLYYFARDGIYMLRANGCDYAYIHGSIQEIDVQDYIVEDDYIEGDYNGFNYWDAELQQTIHLDYYDPYYNSGSGFKIYDRTIVREDYSIKWNGAFFPEGGYGLATGDQLLIPPQMEYGFAFGSAYVFWDGDGWNYYDLNGQMIIADCEEAWLHRMDDGRYRYTGAELPFDFSEGLLAYGQDGKWGYCDEKGQIKVPQIFEATRPVNFSGLAWVKQGGKWGVIRALPRFEAEQFMCTLLEDGSVRIEGYMGSTNTLQVPAMLAGCPVREIGAGAFQHCSTLQSVELPAWLDTIGDEAFSYCFSLHSIELPEGLEMIGNYAFFACYSLSGVTIPASVTEIGENAFLSCNALILTVEQGSYAHEYAETHDIPYTYLEVPDWLMD